MISDSKARKYIFLFVISMLFPLVIGCSGGGGDGGYGVGGPPATTTPTTPTTDTTPASLAVVASPTTIDSGGTSNIVATVNNSSGIGVENVTVTFATTLGTLSSATDTTDNQGEASTVLSGTASGSATVTASVTGLSSATASVTINESDVVGTPTNIICPTLLDTLPNPSFTQIYIAGSGKQETTNISFIVSDSMGNPVEKATILFSLKGGSKGGEYLVPSQGVTSDLGIVSTVLTSGSKPGAVTVTAMYTENTSIWTETTAITIFSGPPEGLHISGAFDIQNIDGLRCQGLQDAIAIELADLYSNPVPIGTAVQLESEYAKIQGGGAVENDDGSMSANIITQAPSGTNGAQVHVWAKTTSGAYAYISKLYASGNTMYAATDGGGVFKTTDGGKNWINVGRPKSYAENEKGLWGNYINDMTVNNSEIMVASEDGGAFYSHDAGVNWIDFGSVSDRFSDTVIIDGGAEDLTYLPRSERGRVEIDGPSSYRWNLYGKSFYAVIDGTYRV
ncbi:MAG: Ig-like domain-containing protein, partial [Pseudomonadota bacterium]